MKNEGNLTWVVPDGWLPPEGGSGDLVNHESLMLLNTGDDPAKVVIELYFEDREPLIAPEQIIPARRIKSIRLDKPQELGLTVPRATQYAIRINSSVPIIVQYGRMDVRQPNLAYYCTMAHPL